MASNLFKPNKSISQIPHCTISQQNVVPNAKKWIVVLSVEDFLS